MGRILVEYVCIVFTVSAIDYVALTAVFAVCCTISHDPRDHFGGFLGLCGIVGFITFPYLLFGPRLHGLR